MSVHPMAVVAPGAKLHSTVKVGPFTVIGANVEIGENTIVGPNCTIDGFTTIGKNNVLSPCVNIGQPPQDIKFKGEKSFVKIGDGNHFRECVTVHLAEGENCSTIIGDNNLLMAYVHIAHNCKVGNGTIMSNCTTLAGHVEVGDKAVLGGFTGIHQFCKVGCMVMIGGMSKIVKDVPPFIKIDGNPARVIGLNTVGLRRNDIPKESITNIRQLFKIFFRSEMNVSQVMEKWDELVVSSDPQIQRFRAFLDKSNRGVYKRTRKSAVSSED